MISILLGLVVGLVLRFATGQIKCLIPIDKSGIQKMVQFDHRYFFNLLLPPIILNSGYDMKKKHFFVYFGSILIFAFVGTFISMVNANSEHGSSSLLCSFISLF